jgi:hypothetical protein
MLTSFPRGRRQVCPRIPFLTQRKCAAKDPCNNARPRGRVGLQGGCVNPRSPLFDAVSRFFRRPTRPRAHRGKAVYSVDNVGVYKQTCSEKRDKWRARKDRGRAEKRKLRIADEKGTHSRGIPPRTFESRCDAAPESRKIELIKPRIDHVSTRSCLFIFAYRVRSGQAHWHRHTGFPNKLRVEQPVLVRSAGSHLDMISVSSFCIREIHG